MWYTESQQHSLFELEGMTHMRELLKDIKWSLILASLLFLFLGVALLIWPHTSNLVLCYIVAGVLTAYGLFNIIAYFGRERGSLIGLIVGIICAAFGVYAIVQPTRISDIISIILGVAILVDGAMSLRRDFELRTVGFPQWWVPFALDVLVLVLGAVVIFNPGLFAELLLQMIGIILIYESVSDLWSIHRLAKLARAAVVEGEVIDVQGEE